MRCSATWDPMKPSAPVTRILVGAMIDVVVRDTLCNNLGILPRCDLEQPRKKPVRSSRFIVHGASRAVVDDGSAELRYAVAAPLRAGGRAHRQIGSSIVRLGQNRIQATRARGDGGARASGLARGCRTCAIGGERCGGGGGRARVRASPGGAARGGGGGPLP